MKHVFVILASAALALPLFAQSKADPAQFDVGVSVSVPIKQLWSDKTFDIKSDTIKGLHVGYTASHFWYASLDSFLLPPEQIASLTAGPKTDEGTGEEYWSRGYFLPGFLNMLDLGIHLKIVGIGLIAQAGFNSLYIFQQYKLGDIESKVGMNLKIGGEIMFGSIGVSLLSYSIFPNYGAMEDTLRVIFGQNDGLRVKALTNLAQNCIISPSVTIYL